MSNRGSRLRILTQLGGAPSVCLAHGLLEDAPADIRRKLPPNTLRKRGQRRRGVLDVRQRRRRRL